MTELHPRAKFAAAYAAVSFRVQGFHRWDGAPEHRAYLRSTHRHLFHVSVRVRVSHDDRQIEFHDLLAGCQDEFRRIVAAAEGKSCEMMARELLSHIYHVWMVDEARVTVSEDGETAATVGGGI